MKIALLGDVHANLPALQAVLQHAHAQGAAAIWNIGDFLGYGAFPNEVIHVLRTAGAISILGNYDQKVLRFPEKERKWRKSKQADKYLAFQWAHQNLTMENRRYLQSLPEQLYLEVAGWRVLLTHGSPTSNEEHLTPHTPEKRLLQLAQIAAADIIVCGHSHQPFSRWVENVLFINTGSVGRPDDGDPRSCYAILHLNPAGAHRESALQARRVQHYRLEYDIDSAVAALRAQGLPEAFAQMIQRGVDLETILKGFP